MILISKVKEYGETLKNSIADIKKFIMVVDDSQLNAEMSEITDSSNLILVGYIPSHNSEGKNVDDVQNRDRTLWMVLNKVDRGTGQEAFLQSFERCQLAALEIEKKMLYDKPNLGNGCSPMRQLQVASIKIDPVWGLAGCDGYEINFELLTPIYQ